MPMDLPVGFSTQGQEMPSSNWWFDFQDSSLNSLIMQAISDNFTLLIARTKIEEARAIAKLSGAALVPSLSSTSSGELFNHYNPQVSDQNLSLQFMASYEIDLWGRLRSTRTAVLLDMKATKADYHTAVVSLSAEVAKTWYQLVESDLQLELLVKQTEINNKVLDLISVQLRSGQVTIVDILQQRQLIENNLGEIAKIRSEIQLLRHQLALLLGVPPQTVDLPQSTQLPILPPLPKTGIPLELLQIRPDVASSYFRLRASDYRVAAAIANRLPQLSISAKLSTSSDRAENLFSNWMSSLGANLFGSILDAGQRKATVAKNEAIAKQHFYRYKQNIIEAIGEVEDALIREKEQLIILERQNNQIKLAGKTIEHLTNRYRQGADNYQRVLLALRSHQGLQRSILTSKRQLVNIRIALYRALSGRLPMVDILSKDNNPATRASLKEEMTRKSPVP